MASAMQTNRVPSSTGAPHAAEAALTAAPIPTANRAVWVSPRWAPRPVSRGVRVSLYTSADSGRTTREATTDAHENRVVAIDEGWSRSGSSAAPAQTAAKVSTPPASSGAPDQPAANPATPSPNAAPDRA